jgi:hypothetical protein
MAGRELELRATDPAARHERGGRNGRRQADKRHRPATAQERETVRLRLIPDDIGIKGAHQPLERTRHVGVMIAGYKGHVGGRAEAFQEHARAVPLGLQPEIADIPRADDMVRRFGPQVVHQTRENVHVVRLAPAPPPVDVTGDAFAEQMPEGRTRKRTDMGIGQMGETKHD